MVSRYHSWVKRLETEMRAVPWLTLPAFLPARAWAQAPGAEGSGWTGSAWIEPVARAIEAAGIGIIVFAGLAATLWFLAQLVRTRAPGVAYHAYRSNLGRGILLGLEFLVAADIIGTVAVDPTLESLAVLAGIVLIRTFLSFSLEVEIDGRWPWRRGPAPESLSPPRPAAGPGPG